MKSERHQQRHFSDEKMRSLKYLKCCSVFDGKMVNLMQKRRLTETSEKTCNQMFSKIQHMAFHAKPNNTNPKVQSATLKPRANVVTLLSPEKRYVYYAQGKRSLVKICMTRLACSAPQARFKSKSWRMKANDRRGCLFLLTS